jgi:hypothetical protein
MKLLSIIFLSALLFLSFVPYTFATDKLWQIQSIDTMKFSRDTARNMAGDKDFEKIISEQVKNIAETGATHVAIATPYDDEFYPFLKKWVTAARNNNLKVWFRGNFAGWEGWFDYPKITRGQHIEKTRHFLLTHSEIFENGDIFSPCPECENGGPGDPRQTGDIEGHRLFLISEYELASSEFERLGISVDTRLNSMNADVARLVMNEKTTRELGGVVAIDHYVRTPDMLARDVLEIAESSKGEIFLGEFGAPIPDIHGQMTEKQQADWINSALMLASKNPNVIGVNYWTGSGGSTQIWSDNGSPRLAVSVLKSFFTPPMISGYITNYYKKPIKNAKITIGVKTVTVDTHGYYSLPVAKGETNLTVTTYQGGDITYSINPSGEKFNIIIGERPSGFIQYVLGYLSSLFSN